MPKITYTVATCGVAWDQPDWQEYAKPTGPHHRTLRAAILRDEREQARCRRENGEQSYYDQKIVVIESGAIRHPTDAEWEAAFAEIAADYGW